MVIASPRSTFETVRLFFRRPNLAKGRKTNAKEDMVKEAAPRGRARQRQSVAVAGAVGGIELSMSPRYVFSSGKGPDSDVRRDGDSSPLTKVSFCWVRYVGRDSDLTAQSFVKAVKVVLEGCGQLPRIVIHRSGFNDEKLAERPFRPPSPKLSGTRTCRGFMASDSNVIETSVW
ncbi:unnamed protein product [Caenorhabditis auriculariae]|uniref:Uncharacterized protein n=1 Tax=Caenorhabditis auriculariae TaxID=2777116 RepID=A0A8S1HS09_9PELO|nr:unnamed protein product [Caenorhabditis auriculariae]